MRCGASAEPPRVSVEEWSDPADVGTRVHRLLQSVVEGEEVDLTCLDSNTRFLVSSGITVWHGSRGFVALRDAFPGATCERSLELDMGGVTLTGHLDVRSDVVRTVRILDWKSGRVDYDYSQQMLGYCALELASNPFIERAEAHIVWLREREVEPWVMTHEELPGWVERVGSALGSRSTVYGRHCTFCPRAHECSGRAAVVRRDAQSLLDLTDEELSSGLATMTPDRIIELTQQARSVSTAADRVVAAVRMHAAERGDIVGASSKLTLAEQNRKKVDTALAWPVLQRHLTDDELAKCLDVRLTAANDAVVAKAPPRGGAAAKREFQSDLEAAGAVTSNTVRILTEKRIAR
jgi:hypothetical protein